MSGGMPAWAVRGAKVVCVDDVFRAHATGGGLAKGEVYTVVGTRNDGPKNLVGAYRSGNGVVLLEITNPNSFGGDYAVERFRPAVPHRSQEQDVARFRRHLHTKRTRTDAFVKIPHHGEVS